MVKRLTDAVAIQPVLDAPVPAAVVAKKAPGAWQKKDELLAQAPELKSVAITVEAEPKISRARTKPAGTKPMGVKPGVTSAVGRAYKDSEAEITFTALKPDQRFLASSGNKSMVCVFGKGSGVLDGKPVTAGQVLTLQPGQEQALKAGKDGLEVFVARMNTPLGDDVPPVQLLDRLKLAPFEAEQIIVAPGTPYAFDGKFNVAEVIVPPGVRTSEHDLGINERYLVLEGAGTMFLDGKEHPVSKGSVVHIPARVAQAIQNDSDQPMRFYCLCSPPFTADTFRAGSHHGSHPPGFDLASWWSSFRS